MPLVADMSGSADEARELIEHLTIDRPVAGPYRTYPRLAVVGPSKVGKTWATEGLGFWETDETITMAQFARDRWTKQRELVHSALAPRDEWRAEGITLVRALRHGLKCDAIVWLRGNPYVPVKPKAQDLSDMADRWMLQVMHGDPAHGVRRTEASIYVFAIDRRHPPVIGGRKKGS